MMRSLLRKHPQGSAKRARVCNAIIDNHQINWGSIVVIAKVIGEVVSSVKIDRLIGQKFLLVEIQNVTNDPQGSRIVPTSTTLVVNDPLGAGRDEIVLVVQGSSARMTDITATIPTDGLIIGIVDSITLDANAVFRKGE